MNAGPTAIRRLIHACVTGHAQAVAIPVDGLAGGALRAGLLSYYVLVLARLARIADTLSVHTTVPSLRAVVTAERSLGRHIPPSLAMEADGLTGDVVIGAFLAKLANVVALGVCVSSDWTGETRPLAFTGHVFALCAIVADRQHGHIGDLPDGTGVARGGAAACLEGARGTHHTVELRGDTCVPPRLTVYACR